MNLNEIFPDDEIFRSFNFGENEYRPPIHRPFPLSTIELKIE